MVVYFHPHPGEQPESCKFPPMTCFHPSTSTFFVYSVLCNAEALNNYTVMSQLSIACS